MVPEVLFNVEITLTLSRPGKKMLIFIIFLKLFFTIDYKKLFRCQFWYTKNEMQALLFSPLLCCDATEDEVKLCWKAVVCRKHVIYC